MHLGIDKITEHYPKEALCSIWQESLPKLTAERVTWFYEKCVFGRANLWLAEVNDDIIGCCAVIPRPFCIAGHDYSAALTADFAIKKTHRILGPAVKLQRTVCNQSTEAQFLLGFPNQKGHQILKRVGYKKLGDLARYVFLLKASQFHNPRILTRLFRLTRPIISAGLYCLRVWNETLYKNRSFHWHEANVSDNEIDHIWQNAKANFKFIGSRTSKYVAWRFRCSPYRNYRIAVVRSHSQPEAIGYVIHSIDEDLLYIVDFLWLPEFISLEALLVGFISRVSRQNLRAISITLLDTPPLSRVLRKLSFVRREATGELMYFTDNKDLHNTIEQSFTDAFVTHGDCDF